MAKAKEEPQQQADERVIVIGAGGVSKDWFTALGEEGVAVAAVVDLNIDRARERIEQFNLDCPAHADLKKALSEIKADFLLDLTVPETHCEVTCAALKSGLPVIGEKPMASSMVEARQMVATSEQTNRLYMVSQSRRWDTKHDVIARAIKAGKIGAVSTVNCDFYIGAHFDGFRAEMASPLLLDMAIHQFDLARMMSGADAKRVYTHEYNPPGSWYRGDASAHCIFEMTGGLVFSYRGSWCAEGHPTSWNGSWRFVGDKGTIVYDDDQPPRGEVADGNVKGEEDVIRKCKELKLTRSPLKHEGFRGSLREMLAFLREGQTPQTECHDNIKSLAMAFAAIEGGQRDWSVIVRAL